MPVERDVQCLIAEVLQRPEHKRSRLAGALQRGRCLVGTVTEEPCLVDCLQAAVAYHHAVLADLDRDAARQPAVRLEASDVGELDEARELQARDGELDIVPRRRGVDGHVAGADRATRPVPRGAFDGERAPGCEPAFDETVGERQAGVEKAHRDLLTRRGGRRHQAVETKDGVDVRDAHAADTARDVLDQHLEIGR